jgi:hypothetical protein
LHEFQRDFVLVKTFVYGIHIETKREQMSKL